MNQVSTQDPTAEKDLEKIIAQNQQALASISDLAKKLQLSNMTDDMISERNLNDLRREGSGH